MPQEYAVKAVVGQNEWEGRYGVMKDYELAVDDLTDTVTLTQKPETPAPSEGQVIYGHIEDGQYGKKLKKDQRDGAQSAPAASSGQGRTDATGRSIERQVAAKIAGELIGHEGYAAMSQDAFASEFRKVTDAVHAAISQDDSDIPFS